MTDIGRNGKMLMEKLGIKSLLSKLRRIHPSHHKKKSLIIRQIATILDNWINRHDMRDEKNFLALAMVLESISREDYYAYTELIKITRYPRIYRQAVNHIKWARLHRKLGGMVSIDL